MTSLSGLPASVLGPVGLVGGFAAARYTGRRALGGAVFAAVGAQCVRRWADEAGRPAAAGLALLYVAAMGGSHPLAKKLGPWTSVAAASAVTALASELVTRRAAPS